MTEKILDEPAVMPLHEDVGAQKIARVYAEALYDAVGPEEAENVREQLDSLVTDVFHPNPDLENYLSSLAVSRDRKKEAIERSFGPQASPAFLNFLLVLNQHDRLDLVRAIRTEYRLLLDRKAGRFYVTVRTATPLPDDQKQKLIEFLSGNRRGLKPILMEKVDPSIIGGLVLRIGDWIYDTSVRTQLQVMRKQLIERSSHEIQVGRDRFSSDS